MFSMYTAFGPGGAIPTRVNYISRLHELGDGCRNMPNTNGKNYPSMVTLCRVCAESYSRNRIRIRKVRNQAQIAVRMYSKYVERGEPNRSTILENMKTRRMHWICKYKRMSLSCL